jgi:hypothetical protein
MAFSKWYYGMDNASAPPFPCKGDGPNFYIGNLGQGTTSDKGTTPPFQYFNTAAAQAAGKAHTFPVWVLEGPNSKNRPAGTSPEQWGVNQANALFTAINDPLVVDYIGGQTIFADIEKGSGGWTTGNYAENTATLFGFLDIVTSGNSGVITGGVYIKHRHWNDYFGSSYISQIPIVVWLSGEFDCNTPGCTAGADAFNSDHATQTVGGYKVMIWQYYPSACGISQDLDITPYAGYQNSKWEPTS